MRRLPLRSPPRVRGKVFFFTGASFCAIFFLEPSGNLLLEPSGSSWVPPDGSIFVFAIGSPPRMRGKARATASRAAPCGITPAYAGKRVSRSPAKTGAWNHPRVCGEKAFGCRRCTFPQGSPPRMRGKGSRMTRATSMVGITPACAGKSARRQAGPPGPAPPPQMRLGWSPPPCTGRQCRTRKSTHARRARIPVPAHTPAPQ